MSKQHKPKRDANTGKDKRPSNQLSPEEGEQLTKDWNELRTKYPPPTREEIMSGAWSTWSPCVTSWP